MEETFKTNVDEKVIAKLFKLSDSGDLWDDIGIGHVSWTSIENSDEIFLTVVEEGSNTLVKSDIRNNSYEKQQDTLIAWSEDDCEYAISFHDASKCEKVWLQICEIQNNDPNAVGTQNSEEEDDNDDDEQATTLLPLCELSKLDDIIELFQSSMKSDIVKENLARCIELENYIQKLVKLFCTTEEKKDISSLHKFFLIFKCLFYLNHPKIYENMFADDVILHVIGAMEYDSSLPTPIKHREYLTNQTKLKQAIPIENDELIQKINQTFRVQYIKDEVLPAQSFLDSYIFSDLDRFILSNKRDIVTNFLQDSKYMVTIFSKIDDRETSDEACRDLVLFVKELCSLVQEKALEDIKDVLFKMLLKSQILYILERVLAKDDVATKSIAVRIFAYIVQHDSLAVRNFLIQESQYSDDTDILINMMTEQMITDPDPNSADVMEIVCTIKRLLEPTSTRNSNATFLNVYVSHCLHALIAPVLANTSSGKPEKDDYRTAQLMTQILECLTFLVEHHYDYIKTSLISKCYLNRILILLKSNCGFLKLASLRFLRKSIFKDDGNNKGPLYQHIVNFDLFKFVVDAFIANGNKDNLVNSAMLELFLYIKEDIEMLSSYFIEKYYAHFESITYVQTFQQMKNRYNILQELQKTFSPPTKFDEDSYFDQEDTSLTNSDSNQETKFTFENLLEAKPFKSTRKKPADDDDDDDFFNFSKTYSNKQKKTTPIKFNLKMHELLEDLLSDETDVTISNSDHPSGSASDTSSIKPAMIDKPLNTVVKRLVEYDDDDDDVVDPKTMPSPSKKRKLD